MAYLWPGNSWDTLKRSKFDSSLLFENARQASLFLGYHRFCYQFLVINYIFTFTHSALPVFIPKEDLKQRCEKSLTIDKVALETKVEAVILVLIM